MNAKLTLSLDRDTIENAKSFARSRHKSLSRTVENYLRQVSRVCTVSVKTVEIVGEMKI